MFARFRAFQIVLLDLNQVRRNLYDDVEEHWVTIRETGVRKESVSIEEKQTDIGKASMSQAESYDAVQIGISKGPMLPKLRLLTLWRSRRAPSKERLPTRRTKPLKPPWLLPLPVLLPPRIRRFVCV